MKTIAFCEIDKKAQLVLKKHWPEVPIFEDVSKLKKEDINEQVDVICGGFPCQDISFAGKGAGLAGERSGLWWEFHRIVDAVRPRAVLVENVEGLLSSNGGRDMGAILDALVELGYGVAWRVLDAQHFGVPQRRRRVFLLALTGGRTGTRRAAQVLALATSSAGDPQTRNVTRAGTARRVVGSLGTPRGGGHGLSAEMAAGGQLVPTTVSTLQAPKGRGWRVDAEGAAGGQIVPYSVTPEGGQGADLRATEVATSPSLTTLSQTEGYDRGLRLASANGVRRLTPRECERLMGWPDDHTRYTADGTQVADSRRYAMCGNGVVAPVATWIGQRLAHELARVEVAA
jgi:DNA (cytosine-5)-methyltransferase 1